MLPLGKLLLGEKNGIDGLSAHDLRYDWATDAQRNGTDGFALLETSMQTVQRYVGANKVANDGVKRSK